MAYSLSKNIVLILTILNPLANYWVKSFYGENAKIPPYLLFELQSFIFIIESIELTVVLPSKTTAS